MPLACLMGRGPHQLTEIFGFMPKIEPKNVALIGIRDIDPGEEICADYGESHHEGRLRCRCGAPNCKGRL